MNIENLKEQGMERLLMLALDVILALTRILLKRAEDHYLELKDPEDVNPA